MDALAVNGNAQDDLEAALQVLVEINGTAADGQVSASYLKPHEFYVRVVPTDANDAADVTRSMMLEQCMNFVACGKGMGGAAASAIRWHHRAQFVVGREYAQLTQVEALAIVTAGDNTHLADFVAATRANAQLLAQVKHLANNFGALAGALMMRQGHHWDAQNTKAQQAFMAATNLAIPEAEMRKVFYLATHPLPLAVTENMRREAANGGLIGIVDPVRLRCKTFPAGTAIIHVCQTAAAALRVESWIAPYENQLRPAFAALDDIARQVQNNPLEYHVSSSMFGVVRRDIDWNRLKPALVMCVGYIRGVYRGTLANSPALKKYASENKRSVDLWAQISRQAADAEVLDLGAMVAAIVAAYA